MVTSQDAKIERQVMVEEIKELRELREVQTLLTGSFHSAYGTTFLRDVGTLEKAARLLLDAKIRNAKIISLSTRLEKDIFSFRGGGSKEKFLTTEEARILSTSRNIAQHLKSIFQAVEMSIHFTKQGINNVSSAGRTGFEALERAIRELNNLILTIQQLYTLERQLDVALER